jgi:lon-related putative ATP-dependent protease
MSANEWALKPKQLCGRCPEERFSFKTTAELPVTREIIGQPRGVRAIEFGIDMQSPGYNIYVLGPTGTGRLTTVERFIREQAQKGRTPDDWIYVRNFATPHQPSALRLLAGRGSELCADMKALVDYLREQVPKALESEAYQEAAQAIRKELEDQRDAIYQALQAQAATRSLAIIQSPAGMALAPLGEDGKLMDAKAHEQLPPAEREAIDAARRQLQDAIEDSLRQVRALERQAQDALEELARQVAAHTLDVRLDEIKTRWANCEEAIAYLESVRADVIENVDEFRRSDRDEQPQRGGDDLFRRYQVNLIVDHKDTEGAPVVVVDQPSFRQLVGRIEHQVAFGALQTDFTMIKAGALHRANGGYLVVRAMDVFRQPYVWEALKRALTTREICIENPDVQNVTALAAQTLEPEPIPLDVKVVLLGSPWLYYTLYEREDDFPELFKVKSDFATMMDRELENEEKYALFVAARCQEEGLPHFDPSGVARVIDHGSRLAEDQNKLSTRFGDIADLVREAAYWSRRNGNHTVTGEDVSRAIHERHYRHDLGEEESHEDIAKGTVFLDIEGAVVGQVNSLSVIGTPDHQFGQPSRITAQVHLGREGVVQIDREVNLTGPIHNKGVLILEGYLGARYAQDRPLSLSASLTFEQSYGPVEGDSASSTELYALLSALSGISIKQGIAVSGSVNQLGQVQPIGGVNEKIEGFFDVCKARGLTGAQGVLIPTANLRNLMLKDEVVQAVEAGEFHLWAVESIDQGIEVLTGTPAGELQEDGTYPEGTVNRAVADRLKELDEKMEKEDEDRKGKKKKKEK